MNIVILFRIGFNEAGAINAGKPHGPARRRRPGRGFNEAGAINAGKQATRPHSQDHEACFNEAGAINAGKRVVLGELLLLDQASMRPARLTPENGTRRDTRYRPEFRFNEAGAINAGKPSQGRPDSIRESRLQ